VVKEEQSFDVAIVGAGPAGSSAAIALARRGVRVALFEAHSFPHDKLCGEFLSPECGDLVGALDLCDRIQALCPVPIDRVELTAPDGTAWHTRLPRSGWGLSRRAFDMACAQGARAAGAALFEETPVTDIRGDLRAGFAVESAHHRLRARAVIAAHGKRAAIDRRLGRAFMDKPQPFLALKAHFSGPPLDARVELHAFPGGYCGLAPIEGDRMNVCLLVRGETFRSAGAGGSDPIAAFLEWMQAQNPRLQDWLSRAERRDARWLSIAQVPFIPKPVVERDILMAGDTGGLVPPLVGDGVAMALQSGLLAAEFAARFLEHSLSPEELVREYTAQWQREFGTRLRLGRLLQPVFLNPRLAALGLRTLRALPALGDYLVTRTRAPAAAQA
jgi:flavin-dependent dehydrogenase